MGPKDSKSVKYILDIYLRTKIKLVDQQEEFKHQMYKDFEEYRRPYNEHEIY